MTPLIPEHETRYSLGTYRKHVDNRTTMNAIFFVLRTRSKRNRWLPGIASLKARRWVVGRAYSWPNRFRRVLNRWEKKIENEAAFFLWHDCLK